MPSDKHHGRGRSSIVSWRVKAGNREVFSAEKEGACDAWVRENQKLYRNRLRVIPPNKQGKKSH